MTGIPDTDTPPFAQLSTPVYSLSSCGADGGSKTLNIVTYASPIAIKPVRKYVVGLYVDTLSWQNVRATGRAVLQVGAPAALCGWVWLFARALPRLAAAKLWDCLCHPR